MLARAMPQFETNFFQSVELHSADEMAALGARVAARLRPGDTVTLAGPLGAGKTVFARGLIRHFLPGEEVPSPTFTLVQTYPVALSDGPAELWHFDLYRLDRPDQVYELGIEEALAEGVSLIEWPELAEGLLPKEQLLTIELQITSGQARRARLDGGAAWRDRLKGLA